MMTLCRTGRGRIACGLGGLTIALLALGCLWALSPAVTAGARAVFGFPLVAGAVIVHFGYQAMFGTLVVFGLGELAVAIRQALRQPA